MIKFFFFCWCSLCFIGYNQAQASPKELNKLSAQIASKMCDCFNQDRDMSNDKQLLKILDKLLKKGDAQAEEYLAALPAKQQAKVSEAMKAIEELNKRPFDNCLAAKVNNDLTLYISKGGQEADLLPTLNTYFKKKKNCKLLATFMGMAAKAK